MSIHEGAFSIPKNEGEYTMAGKPTYEEMGKRIKDLEKEVFERKLLDEALRSEKEFSRALIESARDGMGVANLKGELIDFNQAFADLLGYTKNELSKKTVDDITAEEDRDKNRQFSRLLLKTGRAVGFEVSYITMDKKKIPVELRGSVLRDKADNITSIMVIVRDLTEQKRAEEVLLQERAYTQSVINSMPEIVLAINTDMEITYVNDVFARFVGQEAEDLVGKPLEQVIRDCRLLTPEWATIIMERVKKRLKTGDAVTGMELEMTNGRGERVPMSYSASGIRGMSGELIGEVVTIWDITGSKKIEEELRKHRDHLDELVKERTAELTTTNEQLHKEITERRQAEEALRESEEKYRTILESIEEGYYEVDLVGNMMFFNNSLCKTIGYTREEFISMNNIEYMDKRNAHKVYKVVNRVYKTGKPARVVDWEIQRKDGEKRKVESSVSLIKDRKGQRVGFRGIARDVTENRKMEAELVQTKDFLQNIFDSSIDVIATTDLHGNLISASPMVKDMLGYDQEEVRGRKVYSYFANGIEESKKIMKELTTAGAIRNHKMKLIKKGGELLDINLSSSFLKDERGKIIGTLGIYRDITEQKRLEAQVRQAQRMESIGTLASGIAHNFNNLLMGIQGNASIMLLDVDSNHPHEKNLKSIEKLVQSGSKLTSQLIGYAREGRYEVKPINLNRLVKETSDTFGIARKEIKVHHEFAEKLYRIKADPGQIEQVLLNLYINATDAMPGGGDLFLKTMNITHKHMTGKSYRPKPGNYVLLTIRDTGTGMDEKTMERIFEPFYTTKGLAEGTGLGLASAYGIIKGHGGYIDVYSQKGHGTTFNIYLPGTEKEMTGEKILSGDPLTGSETILLVDDEEMILDIGDQMLKKLGYEVLPAMNGQEALVLYNKHQDKIDMVLLDMVMPGMGGGETYDRLKEINPDIKVLLSSGYSIDGRAKKILEKGCSGFIQKPFNMEQLSRKIREILDRKRFEPSFQTR
ncbi:MAG: PAS domain S-box protein [Thermodesulfobacteriota bacterium]|nr:PAS domain S-box protein [Thermodesulfobacteriota bacterium]